MEIASFIILSTINYQLPQESESEWKIYNKNKKRLELRSLRKHNTGRLGTHTCTYIIYTVAAPLESA